MYQRVGGAVQAADAGRLALVKHFIEERGIPVNTITADEMQFLVGCETDKDSVMLQTPLFSALESNVRV